MTEHPPHLHDADDDADHCTCSLELDDGELTADSDLPPAVGGVAAAGRWPLRGDGEDDDIDGCDVDFTAADITTDAELPVTSGGV